MVPRGGTSTLAVGLEIFNNSSATQTTSYAIDINEGSPSGRKAFTADIRLQNGETISNTPDGTVAISGVLKANPRFSTVVTNTDGSETLTAAQSGALVVCTKSDGATAITLPDPSENTVGVVYTILQTADQNVTIAPTTADGNSLVADGVATSDLVSLATADHKIGAGAIVIGISATKWYVGALNPACPLTVEAAD